VIRLEHKQALSTALLDSKPLLYHPVFLFKRETFRNCSLFEFFDLLFKFSNPKLETGLRSPELRVLLVDIWGLSGGLIIDEDCPRAFCDEAMGRYAL